MLEVLFTDDKLIDQLKQLPVFDQLDEQRLEHIIPLTKLRRYEPGEVLIKEGTFDSFVFFLISGQVDVAKKGKTIHVFRRLGDIFGEMGLIDGEMRSATLTASSRTLCLCIDGALFDRVSGEDQLFFMAVMYKVFAEALAIRLRTSNDNLVGMREELERIKGGKHPF